MPTLKKLDPQSMFVARQNYNYISSAYLASLPPHGVIRTIDMLMQSPIQEQGWYVNLQQDMKKSGINNESVQQDIIDLVLELLKRKKAIAVQKHKLIPVKSSAPEQNMTSKFQAMQISPADEELLKIYQQSFVASDVYYKRMIDALTKGGNPNVVQYPKLTHSVFVYCFTDCTETSLDLLQAMISAGADLEDSTFLAKLFDRCYLNNGMQDQYFNCFALLLANGANPDAPGCTDKEQQDPSMLITMIRLLSFERHIKSEWAILYKRLINLFMQCGANYKPALEYAKTVNCQEAIDILVSFLPTSERQLNRNQAFLNKRTLHSEARVPQDLTIHQNYTLSQQNLIGGNTIEVSANKVKIGEQDLISLISAQLKTLGVTCNTDALASHGVQIEPVVSLLAGSADESGAVTARYTTDYCRPAFSTKNPVMVIYIANGKIEAQMRFAKAASDQHSSAPVSVKKDLLPPERIATEVITDGTNIFAHKATDLQSIPVSNTCYTLLIPLEYLSRRDIEIQQASVEEATYRVSDLPIKLFKVLGMVVNLPETVLPPSAMPAKEFAQYDQKVLNLAQLRIIQLTQQIQTQNIIDSAPLYDVNLFNNKLRLILAGFGIQSSMKIVSGDSTIVVPFIELLLLMHGIEVDNSGTVQFPEQTYSGLFIALNLDDNTAMAFVKSLNIKYGVETAKRLHGLDRVPYSVVISLNFAILVEKILPDYQKFIAELFTKDSVRLHYYQDIHRASSYFTIDTIMRNYEQASLSSDLTYRNNRNAFYLQAILLRIFGVEEPLRGSKISDLPTLNYSYLRYACNFELFLSEESAKLFISNFNRQFPGAARMLSVTDPLLNLYTNEMKDEFRIPRYEVPADSKTLGIPKMCAVLIDRVVFAGALLELYKAKLPELEIRDADFMDACRVDCKTLPFTGKTLVTRLNDFAAGYKKDRPALAEAITQFSSVLTSKKRDRDMKTLEAADDKVRAELLRVRGDYVEKRDVAGLDKLKQLKHDGVVAAEEYAGIRPFGK